MQIYLVTLVTVERWQHDAKSPWATAVILTNRHAPFPCLFEKIYQYSTTSPVVRIGLSSGSFEGTLDLVSLTGQAGGRFNRPNFEAGPFFIFNNHHMVLTTHGLNMFKQQRHVQFDYVL